MDIILVLTKLNIISNHQLKTGSLLIFVTSCEQQRLCAGWGGNHPSTRNRG